MEPPARALAPRAAALPGVRRPGGRPRVPAPPLADLVVGRLHAALGRGEERLGGSRHVLHVRLGGVRVRLDGGQEELRVDELPLRAELRRQALPVALALALAGALLPRLPFGPAGGALAALHPVPVPLPVLLHDALALLDLGRRQVGARVLLLPGARRAPHGALLPLPLRLVVAPLDVRQELLEAVLEAPRPHPRGREALPPPRARTRPP